MLIIKEHSSASYGPRTYINAASAHVTIALASDHSTAGEKCTQKAVASTKKVILKFPLPGDYLDAARTLWRAIKDIDDPIINVAGNGIYTLNKSGWTQEKVNEHVFAIIAKVHQYRRITKIVCGGQTGVDMAGAVAGYALGIETVMTYPKGFKMRMADKIDRDYTEDYIRNMIINYAHKLEAEDEN